MTGRFTHRRVSGFHKAVCEAQNCLHLAWIWIKLFCISWNCLWSPKSSAVTLSPRSLDGLILPWQWHTGLAGVYTVLVPSSVIILYNIFDHHHYCVLLIFCIDLCSCFVFVFAWTNTWCSMYGICDSRDAETDHICQTKLFSSLLVKSSAQILKILFVNSIQ